MRKFVVTFVLLTFMVFSASRASAWSGKEHILFTRLAAMALIDDPATPAGLKAFLTDALPKLYTSQELEEFYLTGKVGNTKGEAQTKLEYWVVAPDIYAQDRSAAPVAPFTVIERYMHFIDLEYFQTDRRLGYKNDLSGRPAFTDIPKDLTDKRWEMAGQLPFAVEHSYNKLVESFKGGRVKVTESKDILTDDAVRWAGYLAHYLQDNTQPHHSTIDYKSQSYFPGLKNPPNVHSEMEYRMVDDEKNSFPELRQMYWPMFQEKLKSFKDPLKSTDPWLATIEVAMVSYDGLPLIGAAAQGAVPAGGPKPGEKYEIDTDKFFRFTGTFNGQPMTLLEMKAHQTAWAVKRTQTMWLAAWNAAQKK